MRRPPLSWLASLRLTVALMGLLATLLLLNVAVPQAAVLGEEAWSRLLASVPGWQRFLLETAGLGRLPTSPVFVGTLALFFLNLAVVLAGRARPAWRRAHAGPGPEHGLVAWSRTSERLEMAPPSGWGAGLAARRLRDHGYRVRRVGERTLWGVRHALAPLGFVLFHLSFFLLCAGGTLLYLTRFSGTVVLVEGQEFQGRWARVLREPPLRGRPELAFGLTSVEAREEQGAPVYLAAVLGFRQPAGLSERRARVNQPAEWGPARVLVQEAGLAPQLWLQDPQGYTLDRVAVAAAGRGRPASELLLARGRYLLRVDPWAGETRFPGRDELPRVVVRVEVLPARAGQAVPGAPPLFEGRLRSGEAALFPGGRLVLEDLRYWAGLQVVSERGGTLLVAGFVAGIAGLVWRLLLHRREVVVSWDEGAVRLVGRSEVFSAGFRDELRRLHDDLGRAGEPAREDEHG